jgi:putative chitinase
MPTLKQGSSGPDVQALQQKLKDLGFDPKGVDGGFGPGTRDAVMAFQQSKGLQADGIAGPATLAALQSASSGSATSDATGGAGGGGGEAGGDSGDTGSTGNATTSTASASGLNLGALNGKVPAAVIAQIPETAAKFGITSNLRLAHFLAQCALESMNFTATVENMNYSAQRLLQVFPKYFKGVDPNAYSHNPQKIGSRVYANRMGNGDEASGDGFNFRGRGYIQLTGKNNYTTFTGFIGEDCVANPDLVATKYPLASAAFFFKETNIWAKCDQGSDNATVDRVGAAVNGKNPPQGAPERRANFQKFWGALNGS